MRIGSVGFAWGQNAKYSTRTDVFRSSTHRKRTLIAAIGVSQTCQNQALAQQQDTHSADRFFGAREHHRECRTSLFDSNCAALHFG
jgi:hypothetical protein